MAGLIAARADGRIGPSTRTVFLHTGGTPALFAAGVGDWLRAERPVGAPRTGLRSVTLSAVLSDFDREQRTQVVRIAGAIGLLLAAAVAVILFKHHVLPGPTSISSRDGSSSPATATATSRSTPWTRRGGTRPG